MTWDGFWHVYWTAFLWFSAVLCLAEAAYYRFGRSDSHIAVAFTTLAVLCVMEATSR